MVAAFHRAGGDLDQIGCAETDRRGNAVFGFATKRAGVYLLLVGDRAARVRASSRSRSEPAKHLSSYRGAPSLAGALAVRSTA
jgi:hypothetical protein